MSENNCSIEDIRIDATAEIKEKIKKNPKYTHPCNKEHQEDMKRLKFANGNDFTNWMQQNGILKNPTDANRKKLEKTIKDSGCKTAKEYNDKCAQRLGFKDCKEQRKEWSHETGRELPKEFNEDCSMWFGDFICENYIIKTFEDPIRMPYGNPGFDWICQKGEKIDHKGSCLRYIEGCRSPRWAFSIRYNNIADWFILSAWDNRDSLTPLHVWAFHKNDIVEGRKFWRRDSFTIANDPKKLKAFEKWEVTNRFEKLKELCNKSKEE